MLRKVFFLVILLGFFLCGNAFAGLSAGKIALGVNFDYDHNKWDGDEDSTDNFFGNLNVTYFPTRTIEVGLGLDVWYWELELFGDKSKETDIGVNGIFKYNFAYSDSQRIVPFLGAHGGVNFITSEDEFGKEEDTEFTYGPSAGIKFFITENASLNLELRHTINTNFESTQALLGITLFM